MTENNKYSSKIGLLVISCDNYSDLWTPFFEFFNESWPDCPFKLHLLSNKLEFKSNYNVEVINVGEDKSWSDNVLSALDQMQEFEYVFLLFEDMLLNRKIDNQRINHLFSNFFELDGNFLTLLNEPKPTSYFNKNFGILEPNNLYRCTATAALWKKDLLKSLLVSGESAWSFEKNASQRSDLYPHFYSVYEDEIIWINAVIKNKWTYAAIKELKKRNINIDSSKRLKINLFTTLWQKLYIFFRSILLKIIPNKFHRNLFTKFSN
jgi:hypothetical protein